MSGQRQGAYQVWACKRVVRDDPDIRRQPMWQRLKMGQDGFGLTREKYPGGARWERCAVVKTIEVK